MKPQIVIAMVIGSLALCAAPAVAQYGRQERIDLPNETNRAFLNDIDFEQNLNAQVPLDATFTDEDGTSQRLSELIGERPVVLALVYYQCPQLCNQVLNGMLKCLRAIDYSAGKEFDVLVISFDERETTKLAAAKKQAYVAQYKRPGAEQAWHFLTGDKANIAAVTDAVGFRFQYDPQSDQYAHASGLTVLTPDGRVSRYLYGIDFDTRDMRLAMVDASAGQIGSPVDKLLLKCFHYDPTTGRYGVAVMRVLQASGVVTVVFLGAFVTVMLRRDRRAPATNTTTTDGLPAGDAEDSYPE